MPLDRIFVDRESDGIEVLREWETEKRYRVMDASGESLYTAVEESSACARCCLGKCRSWDFHVLDKNRREVLRVSRPSMRVLLFSLLSSESDGAHGSR